MVNPGDRYGTVRAWYEAGMDVIEGAFQSDTESCLIARCYRDALPMLLGRDDKSAVLRDAPGYEQEEGGQEARAARWQWR